MPEQEYSLPWTKPEALTDWAILLAHLAYPGVRKYFHQLAHSGIMSSREQRLVASLLPGGRDIARIDRATAYNVLLAVEVLRAAASPREPHMLADVSHAQTIDANELPEPHVDDAGQAGAAD